jgi:chemotaxis-related protein WspD
MTTIPLTPVATRGDCWNTIGVRGDRSCTELRTHVHCRNCGVHASAAARLLEKAPPDGYILDWTQYAAQQHRAPDADFQTVLIFRLGREWLALASAVVKEVADRRTIHSLPHRRRGTLLGLVNVRGELLVCVSLGHALGLDPAAAAEPAPDRLVHGRMLVLRRNDTRVVCAVDEVHGIHKFNSETLKDVPVTIGKAATAHATSVLPWREHSVGVLDDAALFHTLQRSVG